jgi:phosphoribosyl 1,2-cyclic phosphodiesterase
VHHIQFGSGTAKKFSNRFPNYDRIGKDPMRVTMYGTRGSIPTPSDSTFKTSEYGGNTTCIFIEAEDGSKHIVDAGSGIRKLGIDLINNHGFDGNHGGKANLYISHAHWDHIQGFPFFDPGYIQGNQITLFGESKIKMCASGNQFENLKHASSIMSTVTDSSGYYPRFFGIHEKGIREVLAAQQNVRNFPTSIETLRGMEYVDYVPDDGPIYNTKTLRVNAFSVNHPSGCVAYRFTETKKDGSKVSCVVNTDYEPDDDWTERLLDLWEQATLVIADSQYEPYGITNSKNPFIKGYGHSDYKTNIRLGQVARVQSLVLTHHEPKMDDTYHSNLEKRVKEYAKEKAPSLRDVCLAKEGTTYTI